MHRIPAWMLLFIAALSAALLIVGWHERHEISLLPFILGIAWALFVLASAPRVFSQKD